MQVYRLMKGRVVLSSMVSGPLVILKTWCSRPAFFLLTHTSNPLACIKGRHTHAPRRMPAQPSPCANLHMHRCGSRDWAATAKLSMPGASRIQQACAGSSGRGSYRPEQLSHYYLNFASDKSFAAFCRLHRRPSLLVRLEVITAVV